MQLFPLEIVESWHYAVKAHNLEHLCSLASRDVEVVGLRGAARGHEAVRQWFARGGFAAEPLRWFCGSRGNVVVEQRGRWLQPEALTVEDSGRWILPDTLRERIVASAFSVLAGRVVRYQRFDQLRDARA